MRDTLISRARAMQPALRERVAETSRLRRVPDATIAEFQASGLYSMLRPKSWGGLEVHPNTFFDVQEIIAEACPSSAWVLGVVAVHSWQLALFDRKAQEEVWGDDPTTLISSSYAPTGKVTRVEGGFRVSGRWSFSSGCDHCQWVFLGGFAPVESGPPDMRTYLLPRSDYEIVDNWDTIALRGTGSKDIVVDDVFVPEHRTHRMTDGFKCDSPGNAENDAPLFRIPFGQIFVRSVSTTAIGIARGALASYREITATRVGAGDGKKASQDPTAQEACARAASTLDQIALVRARNFDRMMGYAERGERIPIDERVAWRWDSSETVSRCVSLVDEMFTLAGGRAIFSDHPMARYFLDVHGARAHFANRPETSARNLGGVMLGGKTKDFFI